MTIIGMFLLNSFPKIYMNYLHFYIFIGLSLFVLSGATYKYNDYVIFEFN